METNIKIIAQRLNRLRLSRTETETEPFSLKGYDGNQTNGLCGTKVSSSTGKAILVHSPMKGDWSRALVIPEEQFDNGSLERVEQALEWFADSL